MVSGSKKTVTLSAQFCPAAMGASVSLASPALPTKACRQGCERFFICSEIHASQNDAYATPMEEHSRCVN